MTIKNNEFVIDKYEMFYLRHYHERNILDLLAIFWALLWQLLTWSYEVAGPLIGEEMTFRPSIMTPNKKETDID